MNLLFKLIDYKTPEWEAAVKLREDVLRKPLNQTFSKAELEEELGSYQVATFLNNEIVATALLVPQKEGKLKMQRVAVAESLRNEQIGSKMMLFCEKIALEYDFHLLYCHARDSAVKFYRNNGYVSEGNYFDEDGIPHLKMYKSLK